MNKNGCNNRAVAIRFEVVTLLWCVHKLRGSRACPPPPWKFWGYEITLILRPFLGQNNASRRSGDRAPHAPFLCRTASPNHSLISQTTTVTDEACETSHLLGKTESWRLRKLGRDSSPVSRHLASFQWSPEVLCACGPCVGVCRAVVLIGNTMQATSEGKSDLVETRLTWPVATALNKWFTWIDGVCL